MLPIDFLGAKNGAVLKKAGEYINQSVIAVVGSGSAGCTISVLENHNDANVLSKYCVDDTAVLGVGCFIKVDGTTDNYFKKIKILSGSAVFILK